MLVDDKCHRKSKGQVREFCSGLILNNIDTSYDHMRGIVGHTHFVGEKIEAQGG